MVKVTLKLTSPISQVKLEKALYVNKLRINQYWIVTQDDNFQYVVVRISGWCDDNSLYDSSGQSSQIPITKYCPVINKRDATLIYENTNSKFDVVRAEKTVFGNNQIEILVNSAYNSTAISPSFPMFLEIEVE